MKDYKKYKWFYTSSGRIVVGGKSALQNDELIRVLKQEGDERIVMHTAQPGSPFTCIIASPEDVSKKDMLECAQFTAAFSQAWKSRDKKAVIDIFRLSQLIKRQGMKTGTWGVNGDVEKLDVKLELVLAKQKGVLRAVPPQSVKKFIIRILPGSIEKKNIVTRLAIETGGNFNDDEVLAALPAGGIRLVK